MSRKHKQKAMPTIKFETSKTLSKEHEEVQRQLMEHIYGKISGRINYKHLESHIPKYDIPIKYEGVEHDISFNYKGRVILIDIHTLDAKPPEKRN